LFKVVGQHDGVRDLLHDRRARLDAEDLVHVAAVEILQAGDVRVVWDRYAEAGPAPIPVVQQPNVVSLLDQELLVVRGSHTSWNASNSPLSTPSNNRATSSVWSSTAS
jgi:hypothetical protein